MSVSEKWSSRAELTRDAREGMGLFLALVLLVLIPFVAMWPTTAALVGRWTDTVYRTYTHGFLVLALVVWMIWRRRGDLRGIDLHPCWPAAVFLVVAGLVWLVTFRAGIQILHEALLPVISWLAVLTYAGRRAAIVLALPVFYLYFAIPVWDAGNTALQFTSVFAVQQLLSLVGVPAYFVGNTFQIPAGRFEIADGCSGLHFMVAALSIGVLYGEVHRDSLRNRALIVLLAAGMAALTNWLRIFAIVMAGHLTNMQHPLIRGEHYTFGWYMFAAMMVLFFVILRFLPPSSERQPSPVSNTVRHVGIPRLLVVLLLTVALPASGQLAPRRTAISSPSADGLLPQAAGGWTVAERTGGTWNPRFLGADREIALDYHQGEAGTVEAYAASYLFQEQGKELTGFENRPLEGLVAVSSGSSPQLGIWNEQLVRDSAGEQWIMWSTFVIDDDWYTSGLRAQIAYGIRSIAGSPRSAVIMMRSLCKTDCSAARALLTGLGRQTFGD